MSTSVGCPGDWIRECFPEKPTALQVREWGNIWWRVIVSAVPPRNDRFCFELDMGASILDRVLEHKPLFSGALSDSVQHLLFVFPERHLSTQEEYMFITLLRNHPQVKEAKQVTIDIVTKSALIVGNFLKDDIRLYKWRNVDDQGMGASELTMQIYDQL